MGRVLQGPPVLLALQALRVLQAKRTIKVTTKSERDAATEFTKFKVTISDSERNIKVTTKSEKDAAKDFKLQARDAQGDYLRL